MFAVFLAATFSFNATKAEAYSVNVNSDVSQGAWASVESAVTGAATAISAGALEIKEYVLDGFAWTAINVLIDTFTDQIVDWINSGFEGSPMFLENPEQFFGEFGNQLSGAVISDLNLEWLCDPFGKFSFSLDLFLPGTSKTKYRCTFEDVVDKFEEGLGRSFSDWIDIDININQENIVREYGSDFRNGGWGMWLFTSNPKNNKAGAFGMAYNDAIKEAQKGREQEKFGAQLGRGFLGIRQCVKYSEPTSLGNNYNAFDPVSSPSTAPISTCAEYKTTTPGAIVQGKLDKTLGGDEGRLQVADEIDEIIGALATQLVSWIVTGGSGGEGLSAYTSSPDRAGNRDQYGALEDSQDANATKLNLSEKIGNMSKWEKKFKNSLEEMKSTLKERMEKLGEIANKLKCIQYGKDNRGDILNDNEYCADLLDEDSGDITDLNDIEVFKYIDLGEVETVTSCDDDDNSDDDTITCEIKDIDEKISKAESKLGDFESGGEYFDSDWGQDYIGISEWALEVLENFDNDVLKAKSKKKINEIKKNYCFSNENYNANQEKGDICGEISGSEEFAVNIWAKETAVENGEDTYVYWYATGADYCEKEEGSGDNDWDMDFSESTSGSYRTKDFGIKDEDGEYESEEREYSITCYSEDGDYDTVSVAISSYDDAEVVTAVDITTSPSEVAFGKSSKLRWSASNVSGSCYLYAEEKDYMEGLSGSLTRLDEDDEVVDADGDGIADNWQYVGEGYYLEVDASNYKGKETIEFEGEEGDSSYEVSYKFICQDADGEKFSDSVTISAGALGKKEYTTKGEKKAKEVNEDTSNQENKTKDQVEQYTCVLNKYTDNEDVDAKDCEDILADA
ncbi:MAG: hypothetical protein UU18_C0013G0002 [Parcubacteria group bacterium GW2011_GWB2_40_8]|nr:MAG: hypothetical protein UT71_C0001G0026 [Parcubacteria group bacterium GW2011_GWF2_40_10]KKR47890.1 MAG: hypothetical protein UT83_C0002G0021 [Parcubacteria group bacterium GW2011_GWA2_40_143]KKR60338.1 MAG: hypothetical protein UT97_C0002G0038 [Parcubacteria group bacterium GW2011_GWC2_40_31]KKR75142.1 MAG: hypothetical protein UU18_C0013G0002 [Parcubacteria group bacterium GW2011_GWB2_40_8]KKR76709.1 MAG: hypothetical protein UU20_C0020G0007 [Parcubacteria group bacterium GW2011_GWE2_40_